MQSPLCDMPIFVTYGVCVQVIIILDIPSPDHIPSVTASFQTSPFYHQFRSKQCDDYSVHAVFHLCGPRVLEDARYKDFMGGFGDSVHVSKLVDDHSIIPFTHSRIAPCRISRAQCRSRHVYQCCFQSTQVEPIGRDHVSDPQSRTESDEELVL